MSNASPESRSVSSRDNVAARIDVVIAVIRREDRILISRRRKGDAFADLWEFPGGKVEANESIEQALARELREELAIEVHLVEPLSTIDHDYPTMSIRLHPWLCDAGPGEPRPLASQELRWIAPENLVDYTFPAGNARLLERVMARLAHSNPDDLSGRATS